MRHRIFTFFEATPVYSVPIVDACGQIALSVCWRPLPDKLTPAQTDTLAIRASTPALATIRLCESFTTRLGRLLGHRLQTPVPDNGLYYAAAVFNADDAAVMRATTRALAKSIYGRMPGSRLDLPLVKYEDGWAIVFNHSVRPVIADADGCEMDSTSLVVGSRIQIIGQWRAVHPPLIWPMMEVVQAVDPVRGLCRRVVAAATSA